MIACIPSLDQNFIFSPNRSPMKCIGSIHDLGSHRRLMSVPWSGLVGHIKCGAQGLMLVGNRQKKPGSLRDDIWARHWKILGLSNFEHLWTMFRCTESGASLLTSTFTPVTLMTNTFNRTHQTCEIWRPHPPGIGLKKIHSYVPSRIGFNLYRKGLIHSFEQSTNWGAHVRSPVRPAMIFAGLYSFPRYICRYPEQA